MKQPDISHNNALGIDVIILAGGLGTRLRSVIADRPKVLADVGGKPFLDLLVRSLEDHGVGRIILSVGYLKEQIKARYTSQHIFFAEEESPMGTGGGVKNAEPLLASDDVLIMNGDSWIAGGVDLQAFLDFHREKGALVSMMLASPRTDKDYGVVMLDADQKIAHFNEKQDHPGEHFMSAGVYAVRRTAFDRMPNGVFSLETDFFPKLVGEAFYGFPVKGDLIDIGTPGRYEAAQQIFYS
jgi:D-glycero-alpha-D-manno-heptose 1-phosphate guanylyltransferase